MLVRCGELTMPDKAIFPVPSALEDGEKAGKFSAKSFVDPPDAPSSDHFPRLLILANLAVSWDAVQLLNECTL